MKRVIMTYLMAAVIFLLLDALWLGYIAQGLYEKQLGPVIEMEFHLLAAGIFYLLYIGGILYFVILPAVKNKTISKALLRGALLGGLCYATYDLTNWATIAGWPVAVVIVDIIWGMVVTGLTSGLTVWLLVKWENR